MTHDVVDYFKTMADEGLPVTADWPPTIFASAQHYQNHTAIAVGRSDPYRMVPTRRRQQVLLALRRRSHIISRMEQRPKA